MRKKFETGYCADNSAAALSVAGKTDNLRIALEMTKDTIDSGKALRKLEDIKGSQFFISRQGQSDLSLSAFFQPCVRNSVDVFFNLLISGKHRLYVCGDSVTRVASIHARTEKM